MGAFDGETFYKKYGKIEKNIRKVFMQKNWVLTFQVSRVSQQTSLDKCAVNAPGEWFFPKTYICYDLPMLSMIVMRVAKLYVLYEHSVISVHVLLHQ